MGSKLWTTLIVAVGALVVAVTTGTAVIAAIDDQDDPPATRQALDAPAGEGATTAALCVAGAEDCDDTIDAGDPALRDPAAGACLVGATECNDTPGLGGGFEQCATDEPCGDFDARCAANTECAEPGFLPEEPVCPPGLAYEECFPDGTPAGWDCVQLESFPVQIKCYPLECQPIDGPVTILPAPAEDLPIIIDEGDGPVEPQVAPVDPGLVDPVDPGIAIGEPVPAPIDCVPPVDCTLDPLPDECLGSPCAISSRQDPRCLPPECEIFEDGTVACKIPPPSECGPDELCLPPDCAVSSDGLTYCPEPMPLPCVEGDGLDAGCSSPGSSGSGGAACPDGVTDEECAKIIEEQRRNSAGGGDDAIE
jgi:hypothetical protein